MPAFLIHSAVWLLMPAAAITHLWRQLSLSSAPSLLPVTHKTDREQRSGWWAGRERQRRRGITNPVALRGGHEPSERGTT
jgi:hypothetical protein